MKNIVPWLMAALCLVATHMGAYQLGAWINQPRMSLAIADAVAGERAPGLVAPLALAIQSATRWLKQVPKQALSQCQADLKNLAARANACAETVGKLATQREQIEQQVRALQLAASDQTESRIYVRYELYEGDEGCAAWGDRPICPGLLRLREQELRDRGGANPIRADPGDSASPNSTAPVVADGPQ